VRNTIDGFNEPGAELPLAPFEVLRELAIIVRSNVGDFDFDENGEVFHRYGDPTATRAIKKSKCERRRKRIGTDNDGKPIYLETYKASIELWGKVVALRLAAKCLGLIKPPAPRWPGRCS
jgi:hypothetical protein